MSRFICFAALTLSAAFIAACGESGVDAPSIVSEAVAANPNAPDYGWRTNADFSGEQDEVKEYY